MNNMNEKNIFSARISLHLCKPACAALRYVAILCLSATVLCGCDRTDEYSSLDPNEKVDPSGSGTNGDVNSVEPDPNEKSDSQQALLIDKWLVYDGTRCVGDDLLLMFDLDMKGYVIYNQYYHVSSGHEKYMSSKGHRKIEFTYGFKDGNALMLSWKDESGIDKQGLWRYDVTDCCMSDDENASNPKMLEFVHFEGDDILCEMLLPSYDGIFQSDSSYIDPEVNEGNKPQQAMLIEKWTYSDSTHCWSYYLELLFAEDMNGYLYRECIGYMDDYKDEISSVEDRKIDFTYEFNDDNVLKLSWTDEDENEKHGMWLYLVNESVSSYDDKTIYKELIFQHIQGDDIMEEMYTPYYEGEFRATMNLSKTVPMSL